MPITEISISHITVPTTFSYEQVLARLESQLGRADPAILQHLIESHVSSEQTIEAITPMLGSSGLMIVAEVNPGALMSLLGKQKKAKTYLLANPMIANHLYEETAAVSLYVPLRLSVYEDKHGNVAIAYDTPSSLLAQFPGERIAETARVMEAKLEALANTAAGG